MPHVRIGYPHKDKDGNRRQPGDVVYVSPQEARDLVSGGKGKEVKLSPEEIVALQRAADKAQAEKEKAAKAKAATPEAESGGEAETPKPDSKPKPPNRKPTDG